MNNDHEALRNILKVIDIVLNVQVIVSLIQKKIDVWVILSVISIILTTYLFITEIKIKPQKLKGRARICRNYVIITSMVFAIIYSFYTYYMVSEMSGDVPEVLKNLIIGSAVYSVAMICARFIEPFQAKKLCFVPSGVIIGVGIEVYIYAIIESFIEAEGSLFVILFGPIAIIIMYIIPFILSLGAFAVLSAHVYTET